MPTQQAESNVKLSKPLTQMEYDDFISEIESVTGNLTKTRNTLWATQDKLRLAEEKIEKLELHITELIEGRQQDVKALKGLQEESSRSLEEEMKVRESLELMKKVFTRAQLKSKEEQETLFLLQEERDLLLQENQKLRDSLPEMRSQDPKKKASVLASSLEQTRMELAEYKRKYMSAESTIRTLKQQIMMGVSGLSPSDAEYKLQKQRKAIDRLENKIMELVDDEGRGDWDIYDDSDTDVVGRAFFDEDLEDGLARTLMQKLDCMSFNEALMHKKLDCTSFNEDLTGNAYPYMGFGSRPHGSL